MIDNPCNCSTCTRPIGLLEGSNDCPLGVPSHLDIEVVYYIEQCGCLSHPLARQELNKEVITELDNQLKIARKTKHDLRHNIEPEHDERLSGLITGYSVAIALIQEGVKKL